MMLKLNVRLCGEVLSVGVGLEGGGYYQVAQPCRQRPAGGGGGEGVSEWLG